jgi:glycerol uptake facilitator-like aquaporin
VAEGLGSGLLVSLIIGSGIVARLGEGAPLALLQHAVAVGAGLAALIVVTQPVSGAHLNPLITAAAWRSGALRGPVALATVGAQLVGASLGAVVTAVSFGDAPIAISTVARGGFGVLVGEAVATLGLVLVILGLVRSGRASAIPVAAGAWVTAAILATSSTGFANPAVALARVLTATATGLAPASLPGFLGAQAVALVLAMALLAVLHPTDPARAGTVDPDRTNPEARA